MVYNNINNLSFSARKKEIYLFVYFYQSVLSLCLYSMKSNHAKIEHVSHQDVVIYWKYLYVRVYGYASFAVLSKKNYISAAKIKQIFQ